MDDDETALKPPSPPQAQAAPQDPQAALLAELMKAQQESQQHEGKSAGGADDGLFAGMTAGSLLVGLVMSTVGIALLRYARVSLQWLFAIAGVLLMTVPFFITDVWLLTASGVGIVGVTLFVKRFVSF